MKKAIWLLLLVMLLACGPSTTETQPTSTDTVEDTAVLAPPELEETEETEEPAETVTEATQTEPAAPAAANLDDFTPASTVEEAAVVREQDWQKGATDPLVVIIEYGDFQ